MLTGFYQIIGFMVTSSEPCRSQKATGWQLNVLYNLLLRTLIQPSIILFDLVIRFFFIIENIKSLVHIYI